MNIDKASLGVGIDISQMHPANKSRGIGEYVNNLVNALKKYTDDKIILIDKKNTDIEFDLIHYPYFDFFHTSLPLSKRFPTVVTIHDIIPMLFPKQYPPGIRGTIKKRIQLFSLKSVKGIITDSKTSRNDIVSRTKFNPERVFVVPLAPKEDFKVIEDDKILKSTRSKFDLPKDFAIFVGSANWNKNLLNLAKACIDARVNLYLIGKDFENQSPLYHPELGAYNLFLKEYSKSNWIHPLGYVNNADLVSLINLASLTLLPSFYEGFGLPILESQACGTPIITANVSSMPEVAGDAAIFVNPNRPEEITVAIRKLLENKTLRSSLIEKGFLNIKSFSWKKTALLTSHIYHRLLRND